MNTQFNRFDIFNMTEFFHFLVLYNSTLPHIFDSLSYLLCRFRLLSSDCQILLTSSVLDGTPSEITEWWLQREEVASKPNYWICKLQVIFKNTQSHTKSPKLSEECWIFALTISQTNSWCNIDCQIQLWLTVHLTWFLRTVGTLNNFTQPQLE